MLRLDATVKMKPRSGKFNAKRRVCPPDLAENRLREMQVTKLRYGGNPEHKRNPGDFGLEPPSNPRPAKTLCDQVKIFTRSEATSLLHAGLKKGMFSVQERNGWPQNIWAVTDQEEPLEAQLEGDGVYHGYPMPEADPFRDEVLREWRSR